MKYKVADGVFLELQDSPKGFICSTQYEEHMLNYFDQKTGHNNTLNFLVNRKLLNVLKLNGYYKSFLNQYDKYKVLTIDAEFDVDPSKHLPILSLVAEVSLS